MIVDRYTVKQEGIIDRGVVFKDMISSEIDRDNVKRSGVPDLGACEVDQAIQDARSYCINTSTASCTMSLESPATSIA